MKYKKLGSTNINISAIGQGTGIDKGLPQVTEDQKWIEALKFGIECGMNVIDTAEIYGDGHSEQLIARSVGLARDKVFIATKVSPEHLSYDDIFRSAENSLQRLKTDVIDLYQIHWSNPSIPLAETMRAMETLVDQGKVRYIGVCNFTLKELKEAEKHLDKYRIASIQLEYNLLERSIEADILPYCQEKQMTVIAYSPLVQGKLASDHALAQKLKRIAEKNNMTVAQIALSWLIAHPGVMAIPRSIHLSHVKDNARAADFTLNEREFREMNDIFKQEVIYAPVDRVRVVPDNQGKHPVYQTIEEARENKLGFVPAPCDLAQDLRSGEVLKPVRAVRSTDSTGKFDYDLIGGRIRYWAWVIAYDGKRPVPLLVQE